MYNWFKIESEDIIEKISKKFWNIYNNLRIGIVTSVALLRRSERTTYSS